MGNQSVICGVIIASIVAVAILTISLLAVSIKRLDTTDIGLMYDKLAKTMKDKIYTGGLHAGPVGFEFITAPSVYQTKSSEISCLNKDGVEIEISVTYQFKVKQGYFKKAVIEFKNIDGLKGVLGFLGESVLHNVCAKFNTTDLQFRRKEFTETVQASITEQFDKYYSDVSGLQISNYNRPKSFEKAIEQKMTAYEDINVAGKERKARMIEADTDYKLAVTQANITLNNALSYQKIRNNQAAREAELIEEKFKNEIKVYKAITSSNGLGFTSDGLLSYMGIRAIEGSKNNVQLAVKNPAQFGTT